MELVEMSELEVSISSHTCDHSNDYASDWKIEEFLGTEPFLFEPEADSEDDGSGNDDPDHEDLEKKKKNTFWYQCQSNNTCNLFVLLWPLFITANT